MVQIIAELAQGFEGSPEQARLLLRAASSSGANAAKFQMVFADELATSDYKYYQLFQSLEMSDEVWKGLADYSKELNIELHVDIFGERSLKLAEKIGVSAIKLHGTDIANLGLLNHVKNSSIKKVLLGAWGGYFSEINQAISILPGKEVVILLGFQGYPTPDDANQMARIRLLTETYKINYPTVSIGFADHASPDGLLSIALPVLAMGIGATTLEKHLTLGKSMKLEDHESALNPDEFLEFTQTVRNCEKAIGNFVEVENFGMSQSEEDYRKMIRRHVVANRNLLVGESIGSADLVLKRTSSDRAITDLHVMYQKILRRTVDRNSPIILDDID
jgi:N,N'-diacetyllegionaminate synthase